MFKKNQDIHEAKKHAQKLCNQIDILEVFVERKNETMVKVAKRDLGLRLIRAVMACNVLLPPPEEKKIIKNNYNLSCRI